MTTLSTILNGISRRAGLREELVSLVHGITPSINASTRFRVLESEEISDEDLRGKPRTFVVGISDLPTVAAIGSINTWRDKLIWTIRIVYPATRQWREASVCDYHDIRKELINSTTSQAGCAIRYSETEQEPTLIEDEGILFVEIPVMSLIEHS